MAKCSFHSEKEAVEKCTICGKEMCVDCAPRYANERVACPICSKEANKKERNGYVWITALVGFGIVLAAAVITLLVLLIIKEKSENLIRNIGFSVLVVGVLGFAIFMLIKSIDSLKYYNKRYKIALNCEQNTSTTTEVEPKKEEVLKTTTVKTASKKAEPKKATTTAKLGAEKATTKKPATAKKVATKTAAKPAIKTADVKKTTTSTTKTVKTAASKKATTTANKGEAKPVAKKASTTAKTTTKKTTKSTTAKKAAEKKATTKK